jgi:hypothetical protein
MVEYFSFEEVMRELELSEEDLKRMVSEGELRAFRDENKMKFKREDVEHLKKGRITEPTIILPSTPGATQDDTVLDLDVNAESTNLEVSQSRGRGPSDEDLLVPTEAPSHGAAEDEDAGLTTEPLKLADEVETAETVETEPVTEDVAPARRRSTMQRSTRRATGGSAAATEEDLERRRGSPVWTVLVVVAFFLAAWAAVFSYDTLRFQGGEKQPTALTAGLAEFLLNSFYNDKEWTKHHTKRFPDKDGQPAEPPYTMGEEGSKYRINHRDYKKPSFMEKDK